MLLLSWRPVKWLSSSFLPFVLTSAAVPTHWYHRPTVWPICQHCGVKESGGTPTSASEGERKTRWGGEKEVPPFPRWGQNFSFHWSAHNDFEGKLLGKWRLRHTELAHLKSRDWVLLDACRLPKHAHTVDTQLTHIPFPSVCYKLTGLALFFVFLLTEIYLMFDVSSWLAV